ncbi:MAG TPA: hypothetical protein VIX73_32515 [Kofleriaceae bacterium]
MPPLRHAEAPRAVDRADEIVSSRQVFINLQHRLARYEHLACAMSAQRFDGQRRSQLEGRR